MEKGRMIFISGGVRSGKSSYAEKIAAKMAKQKGRSLHYIACGHASDEEMALRIRHHRAERENSVPAWNTWEHSTNIHRLASRFDQQGIVLLDCLTTLLNNELFASEEEKWNLAAFQEDVFNMITIGIEAILNSCKYLIIVSNEVLNAPLTDGVTFIYGKILGKLHQWAVDKADSAFLVEAGHAISKKGEIADEWNHCSWDGF
ncbi:bifunctional adenosylcobinamide kinase/adenosylcobinamide-phosphate guanylyltransferase [Peribacillus saganii]|uniref:Adenosylcobinamide kinase n=1 Tax=Peribacillus saganii TaxID=2303992 RepID=A0A372LT91_9BACI|nr:bifunctional adenosylcobinamide kinase/adenosylcobinamide-phosphate guanylyltransferase [Peribacillus saganii]RFU71408.1 bifunctional adenosylcobinamide kinase/adenosylcobinamide-phosphate guanylyltransferase [Peribacillus saganii]